MGMPPDRWLAPCFGSDDLLVGIVHRLAILTIVFVKRGRNFVSRAEFADKTLGLHSATLWITNV